MSPRVFTLNVSNVPGPPGPQLGAGRAAARAALARRDRTPARASGGDRVGGRTHLLRPLRGSRRGRRPRPDRRRNRTGDPRAGYRHPMTTKTDFTDEEWTRLGRAPLLPAWRSRWPIPAARSRPFKEMHASLKSVLEAGQEGGQGRTRPVRREGCDRGGSRSARTRLPASSRRGALAGQEILDELSAVNELVTEKATPEEADAFRAWLPRHCAGVRPRRPRRAGSWASRRSG